MTAESLTQRLLSARQEAFTTATQAPFVRQTGRLLTPMAVMESWIRADCQMLCTYRRWVHRVIARHFANESLAMACEPLHTALWGIRLDLCCYKDIVKLYGLAVTVHVDDDGDVAMCGGPFEAVMANTDDDIESALVFVWAIESLNAAAWAYASEQRPQRLVVDKSTSRETMLNDELRGLWEHTDVYKLFIQISETAVNALEATRSPSLAPLWPKALSVWDQVLDAQIRSWPKL